MGGQKRSLRQAAEDTVTGRSPSPPGVPRRRAAGRPASGQVARRRWQGGSRQAASPCAQGGRGCQNGAPSLCSLSLPLALLLLSPSLFSSLVFSLLALVEEPGWRESHCLPFFRLYFIPFFLHPLREEAFVFSGQGKGGFENSRRVELSACRQPLHPSP